MSQTTPLPPPAAIIFDLDDTLVDWSATLPVAWASVCEELAAGDAARTLNAVLAHNLMREPGRGEAEILLESLSQVGISPPRDGVEPLVKNSGRIRPQAVEPFPGVANAIRHLRAKVDKLAVLTNGGSAQQRDKLRRTGVAELFDAVLVSGDVDVQKPDPAFYQMMLAQLDVAAADAWMVGDSLEFDVRVAQDLGMQGVWVVWPASKFRYMPLAEADLPASLDVLPDLVVKRVSDLVHHVG